MLTCGAIAKSLILANCGNPVVGVDNSIWLINFDDIDRTQSKPDGGVLESLTLLTGKNGYKYESANNAVEASVSINKGTYGTTFNHQVLDRVFVKSQDIKDELNKLMHGKVVAIVKNLNADSDETRYEVYGWDAGLVATELTAASTDSDGVVYSFTLASDDNAKESQLPLSLYAGTLAATEAILSSLTTAAA